MLTLVQSLVLEQGGVRPVLIVQNDVGNRFSPTVIAAAITSQCKSKFTYAYYAGSRKYRISSRFYRTLEQIRTIDKHRLKERMGRLDTNAMTQIDQALSISFGLDADSAMPQAT